MSNPYQSFFDKLDRTVSDLDEAARDHLVDGEAVAALTTNAADLLKRAGFVLANQLNMQASVYPMLFLEEPQVVAGVTETTVEDTSEPPT